MNQSGIEQFVKAPSWPYSKWESFNFGPSVKICICGCLSPNRIYHHAFHSVWVPVGKRVKSTKESLCVLPCYCMYLLFLFCFVLFCLHQSLKFNFLNSLHLIGEKICIKSEVKFYPKANLSWILKCEIAICPLSGGVSKFFWSQCEVCWKSEISITCYLQ